MGYEIEFFPVGEGSTAGDAITVRYADAAGYYRVMVIDGGTDASGEAIVSHVKNVFGEHTVVSDVVSTHPDTDHSCGLRVVLRELKVERLWIHGLWHHAADMLHLFANTNWTAAGLAKAIRDKYPVIDELIQLADAQQTKIFEPFAGAQIGPFTVLSPNRATYQHLVPQFRKTPDADVQRLKDLNIWIGAPKGGFFRSLAEKGGELVENLVKESWYYERLREGGITAAENESSTVLLGRFGDDQVLLTGDAGLNALAWACDNAEHLGLAMGPFGLIQIPHHGSRRNVSPAILNRLLGPIQLEGSPPQLMAVASVPKDDSKHPRKMVTNAFRRRGAGVITTRGSKFRAHSGMPERPGEGPAQHLAFFTDVEDYD